jgi:hypothetical protein
MHVNAAATSGGSRSSVRAAMTDVPKIEHALTVGRPARCVTLPGYASALVVR